MRSLKYLGFTVSCQEVPNEISLIVDISGCPHQCEGCHSPQLWKYEGRYIKDDLLNLINKYPKMITCVCLMGGEQNITELNLLLAEVKNRKLKTCVYSGCDSVECFDLSLLDYLKIGHFDINKGGLDHRTTNQRFYKIKDSNIEDITNTFYKKSI